MVAPFSPKLRPTTLKRKGKGMLNHELTEAVEGLEYGSWEDNQTLLCVILTDLLDKIKGLNQRLRSIENPKTDEEKGQPQ